MCGAPYRRLENDEFLERALPKGSNGTLSAHNRHSLKEPMSPSRVVTKETNVEGASPHETMKLPYWIIPFRPRGLQ